MERPTDAALDAGFLAFCAMTNTLPSLDAAAVESFAGRVLTDFAGAAGTAMTVIGDRLGLYAAMTGAGPTTGDELAGRTGLHPRLVAEWLGAQAVSGYVRHDPRTGTFELPDEHAMVLAVVDSPAYLVGAAEVVAGQYATLESLADAFRGNGAVAYRAFPDSVRHGIERFFRTAYTHQLAQSWFPAVDGLVEWLDDGARVADVGCGHGAATLTMARTWPRSEFIGFDVDEPSIAVARSRATDEGAPANVAFRVAEAGVLGAGPFDVVTYFDALHDLGDPVAALRRAHALLAPGGIVVVVEPWSTDRLEDEIDNPIARLDFAISTSLCTPTALAQPGGHALGTCGGPALRLRLLTEAGFVGARVAADTGQNLVLTAAKPG
jgi:SAM-dependent methyltransferase